VLLESLRARLSTHDPLLGAWTFLREPWAAEVASAGARFGPKYISGANENIAVIPMIETVEAVANVDKIAATPGVDALYIGPADLSMTLGLPPAMDHDDEQFNDALLRVVAACQAANIVPAIHSDPALVAKRRDQGFRMITIGYDLQPMLAGLHRAISDGRNA
jgi:4-hydroxy-2-oxoheptanedioate aldolase